ncbi:VOC family protein [Pseudonocardia nigra]|uniref:VOC family protein n=1 Tax=Pseudonocardia nigra TaxID=1921578 RepID=UPI001C5D80CD|nr:VOC family protein [Pseudonocardia nigra]
MTPRARCPGRSRHTPPAGRRTPSRSTLPVDGERWPRTGASACLCPARGLRDQHAAGLIIALTVTDLASQEARLRAEGVEITMPLREEPWGEQLFQVTDPNGVVVQLVEWAA